MLKKISLVIALLVSSSAYADAVDDLIGVGVKPEQASEIDSSYVNVVGDSITGNLSLSAGKGVIQPPSTVIFASTPVAGTNVLLPGYNIPAPTATANHKVFIGAATPTPGTQYEFYNASGATLQLAVPTIATLNGATQGGYLSVATKLSASCKTVSGTNIECRLNVNPTPAGP